MHKRLWVPIIVVVTLLLSQPAPGQESDPFDDLDVGDPSQVPDPTQLFDDLPNQVPADGIPNAQSGDDFGLQPPGTNPPLPPPDRAFDQPMTTDDGLPPGAERARREREEAWRRQAISSPITLGHILEDRDQRDCYCEREFCERMWQCAGGRDQCAWHRWQRDFRRSWNNFRGIQDGNCDMSNFKCSYDRDPSCQTCGRGNAPGQGQPIPYRDGQPIPYPQGQPNYPGEMLPRFPTGNMAPTGPTAMFSGDPFGYSVGRASGMSGNTQPVMLPANAHPQGLAPPANAYSPGLAPPANSNWP